MKQLFSCIWVQFELHPATASPPSPIFCLTHKQIQTHKNTLSTFLTHSSLLIGCFFTCTAATAFESNYCPKSNIIMTWSMKMMWINVKEWIVDTEQMIWVKICRQPQGLVLFFCLSIYKNVWFKFLNSGLRFLFSTHVCKCFYSSNSLLLFSKNSIFLSPRYPCEKTCSMLFMFHTVPSLLFCCNPAWIHIKCDCIHQHLPGSAVVWLLVFNLLKCTLAFFHDIENLKTGFELTSCLRIRLPSTWAYSYLLVLLMPRL